ncbi:hypothetical protein ACHAWX_007122 [Stephanocyclus meneghinianus]
MSPPPTFFRASQSPIHPKNSKGQN